MQHVTSILAPLALLAAAGCLEPLQIVAEAPHACLITPKVQFVATPQVEDPPGFSSSFDRRLEYPVDSALLFGDPGSTRLFLISVTLSSEGGSFDFVEEAIVSVARSPEPEAELVPVVRYLRTGDPGATLAVVPDEPVDLVPFVKDGRVTFEIRATSALPPPAMKVDVKVCLAAEKTISYGN